MPGSSQLTPPVAPKHISHSLQIYGYIFIYSHKKFYKRKCFDKTLFGEKEDIEYIFFGINVLWNCNFKSD